MPIESTSTRRRQTARGDSIAQPRAVGESMAARPLGPLCKAARSSARECADSSTRGAAEDFLHFGESGASPLFAVFAADVDLEQHVGASRPRFCAAAADPLFASLTESSESTAQTSPRPSRPCSIANVRSVQLGPGQTARLSALPANSCTRFSPNMRSPGISFANRLRREGLAHRHQRDRVDRARLVGRSLDPLAIKQYFLR